MGTFWRLLVVGALLLLSFTGSLLLRVLATPALISANLLETVDNTVSFSCGMFGIVIVCLLINVLTDEDVKREE